MKKAEEFKYLESVIHSSGNIDADVVHRIGIGWTKWRQASADVCNKCGPLKMVKCYRTLVKPALLYGSECWAVKKNQGQRMQVV